MRGLNDYNDKKISRSKFKISTQNCIYTKSIISAIELTTYFTSFALESIVTFTFEFFGSIEVETGFGINTHVLCYDFNDK